jgi:hypothetical protein
MYQEPKSSTRLVFIVRQRRRRIRISIFVDSSFPSKQPFVLVCVNPSPRSFSFHPSNVALFSLLTPPFALKNEKAYLPVAS